jgi:hypothetical protein
VIATHHSRLAESRAVARIDLPRGPATPAVPAAHELTAEPDSRELASNAKLEDPDIPLEPTLSAFFCPICVETTPQEPVMFRGKQMCRKCRDLLRE